jgi:hypothetical protein
VPQWAASEANSPVAGSYHDVQQKMSDIVSDRYTQFILMKQRGGPLTVHNDH